MCDWFDLLGWDSEPGVDELCAKDVVCSDGVHLTAKTNAFAAVSLCCRIAEVELFVKSSAGGEEEAGGVRRGREDGVSPLRGTNRKFC